MKASSISETRSNPNISQLHSHVELGTSFALSKGENKATAGMDTMFRAQINQLVDGPTLKMEGWLVGSWAEEAKSLMTSRPVPRGLIVDLTDVSYIDSVGEQVLDWLASVGASFMAGGVYAASVCERLRLPFYGKPNGSRRKP